jgi:tRNA threonylcarbamoyladenosine biosynthesis protein TsaB
VPPRLLILETSHRLGKVALALGDKMVGERSLDESRRHARDLVPMVQTLLQEQGWRARELDGVIVSRGPGSYTGLRVGIMSAKTLAYATGCTLLGIGTFEAIYEQVPKEYSCVEVIGDAQQDKLYVQRFGQEPQSLTVMTMDVWLAMARPTGSVVTGPGLEIFASRLPDSMPILPRELWLPQASGLLAVALRRYERGERDDPFSLEPLYLRPSSAEEKWKTIKPNG